MVTESESSSCKSFIELIVLLVKTYQKDSILGSSSKRLNKMITGEEKEEEKIEISWRRRMSRWLFKWIMTSESRERKKKAGSKQGW